MLSPDDGRDTDVELALYTSSAGQRVIHGQHVRGVLRPVDIPASGRSRRYVIQRDLTSPAELHAIAADYLE
jgi:hypothetical protein